MVTTQFVTAGKAIFTVQNPEGQRYTYRVNRSRDGRCYFVALLTGPDNTSDYRYLGLLDVAQWSIRLTAKSGFLPDSLPVKVARWALSRIVAGNLPEGYKIVHAGRCGRCARLLTVPASVESGFGPECEGKL